MDGNSPLKPVIRKPSPLSAGAPGVKPSPLGAPIKRPLVGGAATGQPVASHTQTLKLKPLIRRPAEGAAGAAGAAGTAGTAGTGTAGTTGTTGTPAVTEKLPAMQQLKGVTQKLKGITQQIPQQAILHKTGIIADKSMSEAQKQAAKSRTARISLSDAIGVSPVVEQPTPSRTIRIKRPENAIPLEKAIDAAAPAPEPAPAPSAEAKEDVSATQKKTLRVARPGAAVRPAGKFKKPMAVKPAASAKPAGDGGEAAPAADGENAVAVPEGETPVAPVAAPAAPVVVKPDVPPVVAVLGLLLQLAACGVMGFVGWLLYQNTLYPSGWCF